MSILSFLSDIRRNWRLAREADRTPLPTATYQSVFEFIRLSSFGWVADISAIRPDDRLVARDSFSPGDISYFADGLERRLGFHIAQSEWEAVGTFDDMTRLFLRHLGNRPHGGEN